MNEALKLALRLTKQFSPSHWKRWGMAQLNITEKDFETLIAALKAYKEPDGHSDQPIRSE